MKALFDTSVLIAAVLRSHPSHDAASPWLSQARNGRVDLVLSAHSLAETFSALTAMPENRRAPPSDVWAVVEADILTHARLRTLPAASYVRLIRHLASEGVRGGTVYDAIIAEIARRERVDLLLTLNLRHFHKVWPDGIDRIRSPHEVSPVPRT